MTLASPTNYGINISDENEVKAWREMLRLWLVKDRNFLCDYCGKSLTTSFDMHESLVTRQAAQKAKWKGLIYAEQNCTVLHRECHEKVQSDRDWAFERLSELYGADAIREWYYGLPWKGKPPREF